MSAASPRLPRIATVGVHGFGTQHVRQVKELVAQGRAEFVAVADRVPADPGQLPDGVSEYGDLADLLAKHEVDVVTIATPIQTHLPLAELALAAGADVYLEKPPVNSLDQFHTLRARAAEADRVVQVGFQSLGSAAIPALQGMMASGELGEITGIGGVGLWVRDQKYWSRSPWAGKRELDGVPVIDGVVANALAHSVATGLRIAGTDTLDDVVDITADLYRANQIEADDTSVIKINTVTGLPVTMALTLCADENEAPRVEIQGTAGTAVFYYTQDIVDVYTGGRTARTRTEGEPARTTYSRKSLLENLLDHRASGAELIAPLNRVGAFCAVMDAVASPPGPKQIAPPYITELEDDLGVRVRVNDIAGWVIRAATEHRTFAELGAPFAQ